MSQNNRQHDEQVFDTAIQLGRTLGVRVYAAQLGISTQAADALATALEHSDDAADERRAAEIVDAGCAELADHLRISRDGFAEWLERYDTENDCPGDLVKLPALKRLQAML